MLPAEADVTDLTCSVFVSMLGIEPIRDPEPMSADALTFTVDVTGEWSGSIHFEVSPALACRLARHMLRRADLDQRDIQDAMGEVANMIGGNVKALVPGPSRLSLPRASGDLGELGRCQRLSFSFHGEPFSVVIEPRNTEKEES